ncbi:MAG: prephenate dehydratase domain-containing protein [Planctomycetaceae bacterium]
MPNTSDSPTIVYPGAAGSYTSEVAERLYPDVEAESAGTFADVFQSVKEGSADVGVLPIENTLAGIVGHGRPIHRELAADHVLNNQRLGTRCVAHGPEQQTVR